MKSSRAMRPVAYLCASCKRQQQSILRRLYSATPSQQNEHSAIPRVASPSFWSSMIPKPLRRGTPEQQEAVNNVPKPRSRFLTRPRDWNPYTIFIILAMVAGSNAIQLLALKNDTLSYTRQTEAKLSVLREVVQRVKQGENVDVRKALGTGDEKSEQEWEEVMRELENTDSLKEKWAKREEKRRAKQEATAREGGGQGAAETRGPKVATDAAEGAGAKEPEVKRPKFMM